MKIYKTTQGRYINDNKEWVWNGESYDYVLSHPDWLPLVFKSDSDAKKFERLEKEYKAEQDSKSGNKQLATQAKTWLKNNSSTQVARHSDVYVYGQNYLMHHGIKGQKWGVENGPPYPLNDTVKAIAYRGGLLGDGRKAVGFTKRDVKKARKIVNKNLKTMTSDEIREYKARLMLEREMGETLGTDTTEKLMRKLKDNAVNAVADSIKTTGTKVLTNIELGAVESIVTNIAGPDVAAMVTNGLSKYDLGNKKWEREKQKSEKDIKERQQKEAEANNKMNREKWEYEKRTKDSDYKDYEEWKKNNKNDSDSTTKSNENQNSKQSNQSDYEHVKGETVNNNSNDYKYEDKEKVNGEWRYYYEEPSSVRYESWNSPYLLPGGSTSSNASKGKRSRKKRR